MTTNFPVLRHIFIVMVVITIPECDDAVQPTSCAMALSQPQEVSVHTPDRQSHFRYSQKTHSTSFGGKRRERTSSVSSSRAVNTLVPLLVEFLAPAIGAEGEA
jgi:hypothetical protein